MKRPKVTWYEKILEFFSLTIRMAIFLLILAGWLLYKHRWPIGMFLLASACSIVTVVVGCLVGVLLDQAGCPVITCTFLGILATIVAGVMSYIAYRGVAESKKTLIELKGK